MTTFKKAERTQATLKIALTGPSGSGKTFSGLILAAAIGKKIAVVDTENRSASLYADMEKGPLAGIAYDVLDIEPPYTVAKYTEAIEAAEKAGYDVLLIDSLTHAWAGEGGLLDKKTALDARGGNSYTNWATITPEQERLKARLLQAGIHVIATMRSKQDYVLEQNDKGKQAPKKVGMAPIQRDGMEYEFTTVFDLAMDHNAAVSKDRTSLFDGQIFKISKDTGAKLMKWLKAGKAAAPKPAAAAAPKPQAEPRSGADLTPEEAEATYEPDEAPAGAGELTQAQMEPILRGIKAMHDLGRTDQIIWQGITTHLKKNGGREVAELGAMTPAEAALVAAYLDGWIEHIQAKAAAAAGGNGRAA